MIECEVIRDLLPLYIDEACSEKSRELVEEHLKTCEGCREEAGRMKREIKELYEALDDGADEEIALEEELALKEKRLLEEGKKKIEAKVKKRYMKIWMLAASDVLVNAFMIFASQIIKSLRYTREMISYYCNQWGLSDTELREAWELTLFTDFYIPLVIFLVCDIIVWLWQKRKPGEGWGVLLVSFDFKFTATCSLVMVLLCYLLRI